MADEIYINIGSSFQQPYQGQTPTQAQSSEVKQIVKQQSVNSQTPYQSPSQTPTTYRNPVNAQTDINAQESNPFTFSAQSQIEYQSPYRSPSITQVEAQQPSPYIVQVPFLILLLINKTFRLQLIIRQLFKVNNQILFRH